MKKTFLSLLVCLWLLAPLCGEPLEDDFSFLKELPDFVEYVRVVRDEGDYRQARTLQAQLQALQLDPVQQTVVSIRSATLLARLYTEIEPKQLDQAQALLDQAQQAVSSLHKDSFFALILAAEIDSIHYLINPANLGKGISSSAKINKAYKMFPRQVQAMLMKASSLLYAPTIAGGDVKKALEIHLELLSQSSMLSRWDTASLYSNIGVISMKRKEWKTAKGYFDAAKALYRFDPTLDEYVQEVEGKL